jgi:hypothetical protein
MTRSASEFRPSRLPHMLLIAACGGLALLNWRAGTMPIDVSPAEAISAAISVPEIAGMGSDAEIAAAESFAETLSRPLFRASRRPPEAEKIQRAEPLRAPPPRAIAELPDGLELVGIMKQEGRNGRAMIRSGDAPDGYWVEVGHVLSGWRLSRIEAGSITFEADGQTKKLSLFAARPQ